MLNLRRALFSSVAALALSGTAHAADLDVELEIEGIRDQALLEELRDLSSILDADKPYTALAPVRRALEADARRMQQALVSKGYYAAEIVPDVSRTGIEVDAILRIEPGPLFTISDYRISYASPVTTERPETFGAIGEKTSGSANGEDLLELQNALLAWLWANGYPASGTDGYFVQADFASGTAVAVFPMTTGPLARFGDVVVEGDPYTKDRFIAALFEGEPGAIWDRSTVDEYRRRLSRTGLFREVSVTRGETPPDGVTDIVVSVDERRRRTIRGGVSYSTDIGIGVTAGWENRNLLRSGETFTATALYSSPIQSVGAIFEKPLPRFPGSWTASALFTNEDTDAFTAQTIDVGGALQRYFLGDDLTLSGGIRYQYSDITELDGTETTFSAFSFPLIADYNNENDELNPTSGYRANMIVEPFLGDPSFTQVGIGGATRYGFGENDRVLIAGRARLAASYGADRTELPATQRYYAGGGGSVRGYGFQEAGPIDPETGNPLGGASLAEVNIETRILVRENIQIALFADGGTVYPTQTPDFSSADFLVAAGIGARYITPVGPIRVDIATPLDRRQIDIVDSDDDFEDAIVQFYIALGQPF